MKKSRYATWYQRGQEAFKKDLDNLTSDQILEQQPEIEKRAIRFGMLNYCRANGFLHSKDQQPVFQTEASQVTCCVKKESKIKTWFKKLFVRN